MPQASSVQMPQPRAEDTPIEPEDDEEWDEEQQADIQRTCRHRPSLSNVHRFFNPRAFVPQRVNSVISKRYNIHANAVGCGGYGKVYVADDKEVNGRKVAIKKVVANSVEMRRAFEREVGLMKALDHPNICKILETYENGRILWVVMELCEGGEVFQKIMREKKIDEETTAGITRQVAGALLYAHEHGIAHRDLKPENVCFCEQGGANGQVKVIDWGVGCRFSLEGMNTTVGSATYAAPEVMQAETCGEYGSACDLWSLGVMTYVMLSGKPPFWGNSADQQLRKMSEERYPMHDATWQATSAEAKDFIRRLLKADPTKRMSLKECLQHRWLVEHCRPSAENKAVSKQVLQNLQSFMQTDHFYSIIAASVAKQMEHGSLEDLRKVFTQMDVNGDGVLEKTEMSAALERIYGRNSEQMRGMEAMFDRVDLDGSGHIEWTEFCAAGLGVGGVSMSSESSMRAAFKSFDVNDDNGRISRDEIMRVLEGVGIGKAWSKEVCEEIIKDIFDRFDTDQDGTLDFQEWQELMEGYSTQKQQPLSGGGRASSNSGAGASSSQWPPALGAPAPAAAKANTDIRGMTLLESGKRNREPIVIAGSKLEAGKSQDNAASQQPQQQAQVTHGSTAATQQRVRRGASLLDRLHRVSDAILHPKNQSRRPMAV